MVIGTLYIFQSITVTIFYEFLYESTIYSVINLKNWRNCIFLDFIVAHKGVL